MKLLFEPDDILRVHIFDNVVQDFLLFPFVEFFTLFNLLNFNKSKGAFGLAGEQEDAPWERILNYKK